MNTILTVAAWEYNRFFKWKDVLKGLFWTVIVGALSFFGTTWLLSDSLETATVQVTNYGPFAPESFVADGIEFVGPDAESTNIAGTLTVMSIDEAELRIPSERGWSATIQTILNDLRTDAKRAEIGLSEDVYVDIGKGMALNRILTADQARPRSTKIIAAVSIFLVLIAVFMGFAYQFTAITGEKTQRITEQIVAAISPQTWMDGKILGITAIGVSYVVLYALVALGIAFAVIFFTDGSFMDILTSIEPLIALQFLLFSMLGILMWNSFLAGVAATIDDPNSSQRSGLMMMPTLPIFFAFITLTNPDTAAVKFMSLFPLTSYAVMPAKMVLSTVAWWEPLLALILLAATAYLFRLAAGRIFRMGMMMTGKEPSYKEMWTWVTK
jgi:ABC-2 type transport system permease protein